jgi:hypothetical protein
LAIESPDERLRVALDELYAFYLRTELMLENLLRDVTNVPLVRERFAAFREYFNAARDVLTAGRKLQGVARRRTQGRPRPRDRVLHVEVLGPRTGTQPSGRDRASKRARNRRRVETLGKANFSDLIGLRPISIRP